MCNYFRMKTNCPFEELGCKFSHDSYKKDTVNEKANKIVDKTGDTDNSSMPTVTPFGASDHDIISYTRYSKEPPAPARTIRKRSYREFIPEDFVTDLAVVNWSDVYSCNDVDQAVDIFTRKFRQVLNNHAPWIIFQQRKNFCPWITDETKELMQQREMWYQRARDLALISDGIASIDEQTAWKNYKFYRNKVNNKKKYDEKMVKVIFKFQTRSFNSTHIYRYIFHPTLKTFNLQGRHKIIV